jgi:hypothetical protein
VGLSEGLPPQVSAPKEYPLQVGPFERLVLRTSMNLSH